MPGFRGFAGASLDVEIRGRSVAPVADLLKRRGVPFVLMPGYEHRQPCQDCGTRCLRHKPISAVELQTELQVVDNRLTS